MNYVFGKQRGQVLVESIEDYVQEDSEVRVIDKLEAKQIVFTIC